MGADDVRIKLMALLAIPVEQLAHDEITHVRYLLDLYRNTLNYEANKRLKNKLGIKNK